MERAGERRRGSGREATAQEIISTMHAHPTMHEATREAALAREGRVIHA